MDVLQNKDRIEKLLENYIRIESVDDIPMYSHIRYITLDPKQRQSFRLGGVFVRNYPDHVRLGNGRYMWNVPKYHYPRDKHGNPDYTKQPLFETVFYRQLTKMDRCIVKLQKQQEIIERLKHLIRSKEHGSISRLIRENDAITYEEEDA